MYKAPTARFNDCYAQLVHVTPYILVVLLPVNWYIEELIHKLSLPASTRLHRVAPGREMNP